MARSKKTVKTKGHTRSPRGANRGKPRPKVKAYKRKRPDPSSYPRR
jgi:hypothetical protein